jgi:dihydroorotate dehydrogenase (fumarate)
MIDLKTDYLGLTLRNPLVASSSPLCESVDNIRRMEDAGAAAVVLHSLFEEQISVESHDLDLYLSHGTESYAEAVTYLPEASAFNLGPEEYLEHIRKTKQAVEIPVVGSLNGVSSGGWTRYARRIEEAGADALELNVYFLPTDPAIDSAGIERMYLDLVREVCSSVEIPVAVKLSPYFSAPAHFATSLADSGARALVLFNRFYQPDFDLDELEVTLDLVLSDSTELLQRLRWVAILYGHIEADLAITGGVHTAQDVIKAVMSGANVAMMTSALLRNGISHFSSVEAGLREWMIEREYESIRQMRGSMSQRSVREPAAFERANYMKVLRSYAVRRDLPA